MKAAKITKIRLQQQPHYQYQNHDITMYSLHPIIFVTFFTLQKKTVESGQIRQSLIAIN